MTMCLFGEAEGWPVALGVSIVIVMLANRPRIQMASAATGGTLAEARCLQL